MDTITVLAEHTSTPKGRLEGGQAVVATDALIEILGWELKDEGLCRGDACVPVPDRTTIERADGVDLGAAASAVGRPTLVDAQMGTVVVGAPAADRRAALKDRNAPDFTLPDLAGVPKTLGGWTGKKRLLVAFSSW